ncbi:transcriptional repressor [Mycoplasmoides genitalium]|uniref:transcriptional repressor n=1 Tax=Mycoplasmoides genitalium TaxID=2097 RepID=UPI00027B3BE6|nr:transcriptional repressor [Mycoplasmoides genitalium]AFQ03556.1 hypothetical protein CM3_01490 [Mycoplasmoides genitalium M6282]
MLTSYAKVLEQNNLRLTKPRIALLKCLIEHQDWHNLSQIKTHLDLANQPSTLASLYNNLRILAKLKLINIFVDPERFETYYCLRHAEHNHIYLFDEVKQQFFTLPLTDGQIKTLLETQNHTSKVKLNDFYIVARGEINND